LEEKNKTLDQEKNVIAKEYEELEEIAEESE